MASHTQASGVQPDGTSLPPPRPFGEAGTLTLPRRRRHVPQGVVVGLTADAAPGGAAQSAGIMRVEAVPLTVTF